MRCLTSQESHAPRAAVVPLTVHFAEKLHAYTRPRTGTPNSRVRDLADMVLLIQLGLRADGDLRAAIDATFTRRATHPVPARGARATC